MIKKEKMRRKLKNIKKNTKERKEKKMIKKIEYNKTEEVKVK